MRINIPINKVPCKLDITVYSPTLKDVQLYSKDINMTDCAYSNRVVKFSGLKTFVFMLPVPSDVVTIVARDNNTKDEKGLKFVDILKSHLDTKIVAFNKENPLIREFVNHAIDFALRASYLSNGIYVSKNGNIKILYTDVLMIPKDDVLLESSSPARINIDTKVIQISRKHIEDYSISGIFAILSHEFAHCFLNKDMKDEFEADKYAAMLYLGLGFPRVDLIGTWCKVYNNADNPMNNERLRKYEYYVDNFDKI